MKLLFDLLIKLRIFLIILIIIKTSNEVKLNLQASLKNMTKLDISCEDPKCEICSLNDKSECKICVNPLFLYNGKCIKECPEGTIADNLRDICTNNEKDKIMFTKAFTISLCKNNCGTIFKDCSCKKDCKINGTCCEDYDKSQCDEYNSQEFDKEQCNINNCDFCKDGKCIQCKRNYYLFEGMCISECPDGFHYSSNFKECISNPRSSIEYCDIDGDDGNCKKCVRGFFLLNNECLESCPDNFKADRKSWSCVPKNQKAWYYVYPSTGSCKEGCEKILNNNECSCYDSCVKYGNCCSDYDSYCGDLF